MSTGMYDDGAMDPLVGFNFGLELEGGGTGYFTEVGGLGSETEVSEHAVISETGQQIIRKVPGRLKWGDISLKRGITDAMDIWEWRKKVEDGDVAGARTNISIVMFDQAGEEVARWNAMNAWPSKIDGPSLSASSNDIVIEELTIVHDYIERVA